MFKNWIRKNPYNMTSFWLILLLLLTTVFSIPLFIYHCTDIFVGMAIGIAINCIYYLALGIITDKGNINSNLTKTIVIVILRFCLIVSIFIFIAILYFACGFKAINVFSLTGALIVPIFIYIICLRKEKNHGSI